MLPAKPEVWLEARREAGALVVDMEPVACEIRRWKSVGDETIWAVLAIVRDQADAHLADRPQEPYRTQTLGANVVVTLVSPVRV